jgi:hypothetical protein
MKQFQLDVTLYHVCYPKKYTDDFWLKELIQLRRIFIDYTIDY